MGKRVIHAELHAGFFIPGTSQGGNFKTTLPPTDKTLTDLTMELDLSGWLFMNWKDRGFSKKAAIPSGNIKVLVFDPEEK